MKVQGVLFFSCLFCLAITSACSPPKATTPLPPDQITPEPYSSPIPAPTEPNSPTPSAPYPVELPATEQAFPSEFPAPTEQSAQVQSTEFIGVAIPVTEAPTESFFPNAATMEMVNACSFLKPDEVKSILLSQPSPALEQFADNESYGSYCRYLDDDGGLVVGIAKGTNPTSRFDLDMENIKTNPFFGQFEANGAKFYVAGGRISDSASQEYFVGVIIKNDSAAEVYIDEKNYKYDLNRENEILLRIAESLPSPSPDDVITNACLLLRPEEVGSYIPVPPQPKRETKNSGTERGSLCSYIRDDMEFDIGISSMPTLIDQFRSRLQSQMSQIPSLRNFSSSNADIYLMGGVNEQTGIGDTFEGVILKGDVAVSIFGKGDSFVYDFDRESFLLKNIAARLP